MDIKKDRLKIFLDRLKKINMELDLVGNYPWVYINKINDKKVKEKHASEWGFVLGYTGRDFTFETLSEIFKLLRKYK